MLDPNSSHAEPAKTISNDVSISPPQAATSGCGKTLKEIRSLQKKFLGSGRTHSLDFRLEQLSKLAETISRNESLIIQALGKDLGKPDTEAFISEVGFLYQEIRHIRRHLGSWMKPQKGAFDPATWPGVSKVYPEPRGQVLIIGPWNYPFQLMVAPLAGSIAAGNCNVLKPSELTPHTSRVLCEILQESFTEDYLAVFEGGVPVSTELLNDPWDHIFFTGSPQVGRVVAEKAAKHLGSTTLELGGKSPCVVHDDANIELAAKRITWGKFQNAGQTCIAPDYLLVHSDVKDELIKALISRIRHCFGDDPMQSSDFGRIVSRRHTQRLAELLRKGDGDVVFGGHSDAESHYMAPTIIDNVAADHGLMQEEIFGPLLPVITYDDPEKVPGIIESTSAKPLALYVFTSNEAFKNQLTTGISFGGGCVNDTLMHIVNHDVPFGGVGTSGLGSYHGVHSFRTFSHFKTMFEQNAWFDHPVRYPPYKPWQQKIFRVLMRK